jgi:hypothetical protein
VVASWSPNVVSVLRATRTAAEQRERERVAAKHIAEVAGISGQRVAKIQSPTSRAVG